MLRVAFRALNPKAVQHHHHHRARTFSANVSQPPDPEQNPPPAPPLTVKQVYKNLLHLGKDFPKGYEYFRDRCKAAFLKNRDVSDAHQIEVLLARAVYVTKELEALYMLKKYRTLKKRYYAEELK